MLELAPAPRIRLFKPFLLFVVVLAAISYGIIALNSQNLLWFKSQTVNARPDRIIILNYGEKTLVQPGSPGFEALADAVETSLSQISSTDLISIGLSPQTLADYEGRALVLQLLYNQPVNFQTLARTGRPTQLLIPIEGRHAGNGYFFRGDAGEWWYGAMRMGDPTPIYQALQQAGYTVLVPRRTG